jgi:peroxisome-assembly ATPase
VLVISILVFAAIRCSSFRLIDVKTFQLVVDMIRTSLHAACKRLLERCYLTPNPSQAALVDRLSGLQQSLADLNYDQGGLYIYGDVGTGKSRLADLFAATMPPSISTRRVHFHEFMMDIHSRLHHARSVAGYSGDPLPQIGREVRNESKVLCFDEFQVTDIADAMIIKRLFGAIWDNGGAMVATSNQHPENLYERGLNRSLFLPFIKELQKRCEVWKMEGGRDYRMGTAGNERERETVFFTDAQEFEESLLRATNGATLKPLAVSVIMNRQFQVQAYRSNKGIKSVVKSTFKELCEANLGPSDYYALCKTASIVYLSGVRRFKPDEFDFVRRFITLIDLAYEARTRIVCLSAAPLFKLFEEVVPSARPPAEGLQVKLEETSVRRGGGSSSSMMSTFIGDMEWSATGLPASLASGGAGETDFKFTIGRAVSRLSEMGSKAYGIQE